MSTEYRDLTDEEKELHLNMLDDTGSSGILGLYEANYLDTSQVLNNEDVIDESLEDIVYDGAANNSTDSTTSIVKPQGLVLNFSNAKASRDYSINDFSIFNPYIHYIPNPNGGKGELTKSPYHFTIDTSQFINQAVTAFNIYSSKYRTW